MSFYISVDANGKPNGRDTKPFAGGFEVSEEIYNMTVTHPDRVWNGVALVIPATPEVFPPTQEEIAANKQYLVDAISAACKEYIEHQVNAALQVEIYPQYLAAAPHPMVVATVNWVKSGYMTAEIRKSQVLAGIADNATELCDFSMLGQKPYTVYQLYTAGIVRM